MSSSLLLIRSSSSALVWRPLKYICSTISTGAAYVLSTVLPSNSTNKTNSDSASVLDVSSLIPSSLIARLLSLFKRATPWPLYSSLGLEGSVFLASIKIASSPYLFSMISKKSCFSIVLTLSSRYNNKSKDSIFFYKCQLDIRKFSFFNCLIVLF